MHGIYRATQDALASLFDLILPRRARTLRTAARKETDIPLRIVSHRLLDEEIMTLMDYRDPAVQDLIRSLKYDGSGHGAHLCARILADFLQEEIATAKAFSPRRVCLVPMPLHPARERERGFNQIGIVLDRLPASLRDGMQARLAPHALARTKATRSQAHLTRSDRIKNMRGAFEVPRAAEVSGSRVILIDDVTTTGATLKSATAALRKAGAEVTPIALARA